MSQEVLCPKVCLRYDLSRAIHDVWAQQTIRTTAVNRKRGVLEAERQPPKVAQFLVKRAWGRGRYRAMIENDIRYLQCLFNTRFSSTTYLHLSILPIIATYECYTALQKVYLYISNYPSVGPPRFLQFPDMRRDRYLPLTLAEAVSDAHEVRTDHGGGTSLFLHLPL